MLKPKRRSKVRIQKLRAPPQACEEEAECHNRGDLKLADLVSLRALLCQALPFMPMLLSLQRLPAAKANKIAASCGSSPTPEAAALLAKATELYIERMVEHTLAASDGSTKVLLGSCALVRKCHARTTRILVCR